MTPRVCDPEGVREGVRGRVVIEARPGVAGSRPKGPTAVLPEPSGGVPIRRTGRDAQRMQ
jgi:hypothetical protein